MAPLRLFICLLVSHTFISGVVSTSFSIVNKCEFTVWPGILSNAGIPTLAPTGFGLRKGETRTINAPSSWGGRFWGRASCSTDSTEKFSCATGDCGSGKLECSGSPATPPATLAEFKLDGSGGLDFYDVSLVDGYNLPMLVVPDGGAGQNCTTTGCVVDLNGACPPDLRVLSENGKGQAMACKSACEAFGQPQYCCSGAYGSPNTCKPSSYSQVFKSACPRAYSYAYDDTTSTFTCASSPGYTITFCPSPNSSQKSSQVPNAEPAIETPPTDPSSPQDSSMIYEGALDVSSGSPSTCLLVARSHLLIITVGISLAFCRSSQLVR